MAKLLLNSDWDNGDEFEGYDFFASQDQADIDMWYKYFMYTEACEFLGKPAKSVNDEWEDDYIQYKAMGLID
jgi:hypothetical protein